MSVLEITDYRINCPTIVVEPIFERLRIEQLSRVFDAVSREQDWVPEDQPTENGHASIYFAAISDGVIIGGIRLVCGNSTETLPCMAVWPELPLAARDDVAELTVLALLRAHRGNRNLIWQLAAKMWQYCVAQEIKEIWAEITPANLRIYRRIGWPFEVAGPLRLHWGEECYPCRAYVQQGFQAVVERAKKSPFFRNLLDSACPNYRETQLR
jgi:hypothetical protein